MTQQNIGIIGEHFAAWNGMGATYINTSRVPKGFRMLCESMPHYAHDHIVYGQRDDGQYIGIGQPYPKSGDDIVRINEYCKMVGLEMTITGESTWTPHCIRILFQRDDENMERFDIAMNCTQWSSSYPSRGNTQSIIDNVNYRLNGLKSVLCSTSV